MIIIGVDPGVTGGIVALDAETNQIIGKHTMPTITTEGTTKTKAGNLKKRTRIDPVEVARIIRLYPREETEIIMELVGPMPGSKNGAAALFSFGEGFGLLKGLFCGLRYKYSLVRPQRWQLPLSELKELYGRNKYTKVACQRAFRGVDFRESERCRTPHSGLVDAALIALFYANQREQKINQEWSNR
jgi:crossover junction endodeoxyribonuclease RuvC